LATLLRYHDDPKVPPDPGKNVRAHAAGLNT